MSRTTIALLALLALAACATESSSPEPAVTAADQSVVNSCNPRNYPCDPTDPFANGVCAWICGDGEPGAGYCMPYTSVEDVWCAAHPDHFFSFSPQRYCDYLGNPTWETHCAPGWTP